MEVYKNVKWGHAVKLNVGRFRTSKIKCFLTQSIKVMELASQTGSDGQLGWLQKRIKTTSFMEEDKALNGY